MTTGSGIKNGFLDLAKDDGFPTAIRKAEEVRNNLEGLFEIATPQERGLMAPILLTLNSTIEQLAGHSGE